ncbi:M1 family metallopeptidase [Aestuariivivens sediminis]|uniref:M1 family metallopeptidase n=1 Tax=Aestuariivivens sediminis TaxID=2913557 RepID=UPI001F58C5C4|nr:M1 family metallopeptidase [Aestuariivivens sediminis]
MAFWIKVCYIRSMKVLLQLCFCFISLFCFSQQAKDVDFKSAKVHVEIQPTIKKVKGQVAYTLDILKAVDSLYIDAVNMNIKNIELIQIHQQGDPEFLNFECKNNTKQLIIYYAFKQDERYELRMEYVAHPRKAMYFVDWVDGVDTVPIENNIKEIDLRKQVWTQGQGKYTSNWLPSIDDMNDKIEFDLSITFKKGFDVITNGRLTHKETQDSTITWHYDMEQSMSSYLVALVIGKYDKKIKHSKSGIPLEMYYYPEDSLKYEPTYRYTKGIFDFFEEEIGVPYPWQNYKQIPVKDFLYAGMENTGTTIFSDSFVIDSIAFVDKNYVNVNAHELAHQWFGDLVTETSGTHHWLQEGFATYYALLAEAFFFGDDYYYWNLYQYVQELLVQEKSGQSSSLLDPKSSSTTFYKKGALVLHLLREKIGNSAFRETVKNYLLEYSFKNVRTEDFINEAENLSGKDLSGFVDRWLKDKTFYIDDAMESLEKSTFIQEYLMVDCEIASSKCITYLNSGISDESKEKVITQNANLIKKEHFKNSVKVRQAIARYLVEIPKELKIEYESLLNDKSYLTVEFALYNLWTNFPESRGAYLRQTKGMVGFRDKNIRTLWLTLALLTSNFEPENSQQYYKELRDYTNSRYDFNIRMNAFKYLSMIKACDQPCKNNLKQASTHHVWQFSKFARQLLKEFN